MAQTLEQNINSTVGGDLSQKNLLDREQETKPFDEILKSISNKKPLRSLKYGVKAAQKVTNFIGTLLASASESK